MAPGPAFGTTPYLVAAACAAGLLLRYQRSCSKGEDLKAECTKALRLFRGGVSWRCGLLLLILGHLAGLLLPREVLAWNGEPWRLLVLEGTAFLIGAWTLLGLVGLLRRHLFDSADGPLSSVMDFTLLGLLFIQVVSGLAMAGVYRWASSWSAVTLTPYVHSLFRLDPLPELVARMPYVVQLHVFLTFAVVAILPWTRLAYFFLYPLHRTVGILFWPIDRLADAVRPHLARWRRRTMAVATYWWDDED